MKKQAKKLKLAKETVRCLEAVALNKVAAGSPTDAFWSCRVCDWQPITEATCNEPTCYAC